MIINWRQRRSRSESADRGIFFWSRVSGGSSGVHAVLSSTAPVATSAIAGRVKVTATLAATAPNATANFATPSTAVVGGAADKKRRKKLGRVGDKWVPFTDGLELAKLRAENLAKTRAPQKPAGEPERETSPPEPEPAKRAPAPASVDVRPFAELVSPKPAKAKEPDARKVEAKRREVARQAKLVAEAEAAARVAMELMRRKRDEEEAVILLLAA